MKTKEEYKLIPMSEITDEARQLAVAWMECEDKNWIGQKHKLASDIMNYAKKYHASQPSDVSDKQIKQYLLDKYKPIFHDGIDVNKHFRKCAFDEIKAMRDGKIKPKKGE